MEGGFRKSEPQPGTGAGTESGTEAGTVVGTTKGTLLEVFRNPEESAG